MKNNVKKEYKNHTASIYENVINENTPQCIIDAINSNPNITFKRIKFDNTDYYITSDGDVYNRFGNLMSKTTTNTGYARFCGISRQRAVAFAFGKLTDINDRKHVIDHIDGNKLNNNINNLQVITQKENCKKRDANGHANSKKIDMYNYKTNEYVMTFESGAEAARYLNTSQISISNILHKKMYSTAGFTFVFSGEEYVSREKMPQKPRKPYQYKSGKPQGKPPKYEYTAVKDGVTFGPYKGVTAIINALNLKKTDKHDVLKCCTGKRSSLRGYVIHRKEISK